VSRPADGSFARRIEELLGHIERLQDTEVLAMVSAFSHDYRGTESERDLVLALGMTLKVRSLPAEEKFAAALTQAIRSLDEIGPAAPAEC
jgi:hypothetical protein